jgi:hypothetical protein
VLEGAKELIVVILALFTTTVYHMVVSAARWVLNLASVVLRTQELILTAVTLNHVMDPGRRIMAYIKNSDLSARKKRDIPGMKPTISNRPENFPLLMKASLIKSKEAKLFEQK